MLKVFYGDADGPLADKVNFVDHNNILVGYDLRQCCCEDASWGLYKTDDPQSALAFDTESIKEIPYHFDKEFFQEDRSEAYCAIFRLKSDNGVAPDVYLILSNYHNGYYAHGFEMKDGPETLKEGYL